MERAHSLLEQANTMHRLHDIWGVGGGQRPVRALQHEIELILKEYITSDDSEEAARSLRLLEVS